MSISETNTGKLIKKALKIQQSIEGYTPETALLLTILPELTMLSEWQALVNVKHHRYGKLSYECHKFYYPSPLLKSLEKIFTQPDWDSV